MNNWKWTTVWESKDEGGYSDGLSVGFSQPCMGNYGWRRWHFPCNEEHRDHGHIVLSSGDGFAWIPFPCESQEGAKLILDLEKYLSEEEKEAIKNLPEVKQLPEKLTTREHHILCDPESANRFGLCGWFSEG